MCSTWLAHNTHLSIPDLSPITYSSSPSLHTFSPLRLTSRSSSGTVVDQEQGARDKGLPQYLQSILLAIPCLLPAHTSGKHLHAGPRPSHVLLQHASQFPSSAFYLPVIQQQALLDNHASVGSTLAFPPTFSISACCVWNKISLLHRAHSCAGWYLGSSASL